MIDFTPIVNLATQLPHPSDIGLVKPSGGFSIVPVAFGLIALFQVANFFWFGTKDNEPTEGWGLSSDSTLFSYRWRQFFGVQVLAIIVGISVILIGPETIFFPLGLK